LKVEKITLSMTPQSSFELY